MAVDVRRFLSNADRGGEERVSDAQRLSSMKQIRCASTNECTEKKKVYWSVPLEKQTYVCSTDGGHKEKSLTHPQMHHVLLFVVVSLYGFYLPFFSAHHASKAIGPHQPLSGLFI